MMQQFKSFWLLTLLSVAMGQNGGVIDMVTGDKLDVAWLSTGSAVLSTEAWTTYQSAFGFFATAEDSFVIFLSLPDIGNGTLSSGRPTATRLRDISYNPSTKRVTFDARVYVPNDTFCSTEWAIPTPLTGLPMDYLVAEKGAYLLRDEHVFIVGDGELNRTTGDLNDDVNWFWFDFQTGCTYGWNNPSDRCRFQDSIAPLTDLGAIATIQTLVYDEYLFLRVFRVQRSRVGMVLTPHDSTDPTYFTRFSVANERAAYLVFPTGINLTCFEGIQFETAGFDGITSESFEFTYRNTYAQVPSIFGIIVTQNSLTDSTSLRVWGRTIEVANAITQEDQCAEEQFIHTTAERATMFIFSFWGGGGPCCFSNLCDPSANPTVAPTTAPTAEPTIAPTGGPTSAPTLSPTVDPTSAPTLSPTYAPTIAPTVNDTCKYAEYDILLIDLFGDGWHNIDILVTVDDVTYNYTMDCQNCSGMIHHNSSSCKLNISMVSDGKPITPWEVRWLIKHNNETHVGGWGSELYIRDKEVWGDHMLSYDPKSKSNECHECPHPKPKATPGLKGGGGNDDKSNDDGDYNSTSGAGAGSGGAGKGPGKGPGAKPKPKPKPPATVRIDIFDQMKNGWYAGRKGEFTGVCDDELCMGSSNDTCPADIIDAPDILTYPKYYIMNEDKTKLIHEGTICDPRRGVDICEEVMPYDGTFYFRVAGIEPEGDAATWKFCGREGGIDTELEFIMKMGHCIPAAQTTSKRYCDGLKSVATVSATIFLEGMKSDTLDTLDSKLLETDIALLMPYPERVTLTGWQFVESAEGSGVEATFEAVFVVKDSADHSNVFNAIENVRSQLDESMSSGNFIQELKASLTNVPNSLNDPLRLAKTGVLKDVRLVDEYYLGVNEDIALQEASGSTVSSSPNVAESSGSASVSSNYNMEMVIAACAFLVVGGVAAAFSRRRGTHSLLPTDSAHDEELPEAASLT